MGLKFVPTTEPPHDGSEFGDWVLANFGVRNFYKVVCQKALATRLNLTKRKNNINFYYQTMIVFIMRLINQINTITINHFFPIPY